MQKQKYALTFRVSSIPTFLESANILFMLYKDS